MSMTKEQTIEHYMKCLKIDRKEAEELYQADLDDDIGEEGEKLQAKANAVKPKADRKKRTATPKERKVDSEKLALLEILAKGLNEHNIAYTIEKEVAIHFAYNNSEYSVKLTKHRPPK